MNQPKPKPATENLPLKPILSLEEYEELREEYVGVCLECGHQQDNVEPDARKYACDECEEPAVYGVEELLMMGQVG